MKTINVNSFKFKAVGDFLLKNHEKAYKSPQKAKNIAERAEMEKLFKAGQISNKVFNEELSLLAEKNNLYDVRNRNFLDGSFTKIRSYYWVQLKSAEYYSYPESISVFCEVVEQKQIRYRVSLEINENAASADDMEMFLTALEKPLNKELCYLGSKKYGHRLEILSFNKKVIKEKIKAGEYSRVQISYLVKKCESDTDLLKELDKGIKLLLPYYKYIME